MDKPQLVLSRLDELVYSRSILKHPFYIAWEQGELTHDQLAAYAGYYYPHVAAFPGYLRAAIANTQDEVVRDELQRNLKDELTDPKAHDELWLDFAAGLGLNPVDVANASPKPAVQKTVASFRHLSSSGTIKALAALYSYESQQPEVSKKKADGLRKYYGVNSTTTLAYFEVHAETDISHREGERNAISRCLAGGESQETLLASADQALASYWGLLDGVCEEAGIRC